MYLPRRMPSTSNAPTFTCVSPRSATMAFASATVLTLRGSMSASKLRLAVAFGFRVPVHAARHRELLLRRKNELVTSDHGEVHDADQIPHDHTEHTLLV